MQVKESEWKWQWERFDDLHAWLFSDWISPHTIESFAGEVVLDAGCGSGFHVRLVSPFAKEVHAVDLNAVDVAKTRNRDLDNVVYHEADIAEFDPGIAFDTVYCVGVVHHTIDPDRTVERLKTLVKPGGRLILWVYSREGNLLRRRLLLPIKQGFLSCLPRKTVLACARFVTALLYPVVYSLYLMPLPWLPYYEYFRNWRRLPFRRNLQNVFDHMNSPVDHFISKDRASLWLAGWYDVHLSSYRGVSWRISGRRPVT